MDTSNRLVSSLAVVLGDAQIKQSSLTQADWEVILALVINETKAKFCYLDGFVIFGQMITHHSGMRRHMCSPAFKSTFQKAKYNAGEKVRFRRICKLPIDDVDQARFEELNRLCEHWLVLSQYGELFKCWFEYEPLDDAPVVSKPPINKSPNRDFLQVKIARLTAVAIEELLLVEIRLLVNQPKVGSAWCLGMVILQDTLSVLRNTAESRRKYLAEIEVDLGKIESICSRIEV